MTANLDFCKELYRLTGWDTTYFKYAQFQNNSSPEDQRHIVHTTIVNADEVADLEEKSFIYQLETTPAYDIEFLLDKMPFEVRLTKMDRPHDTEKYLAQYFNEDDKCLAYYNATLAADALCKLASELVRMDRINLNAS